MKLLISFAVVCVLGVTSAITADHKDGLEMCLNNCPSTCEAKGQIGLCNYSNNACVCWPKNVPDGVNAVAYEICQDSCQRYCWYKENKVGSCTNGDTCKCLPTDFPVGW